VKTSPSAQAQAILATLVSLTGCASIVSGRHADVAFDSYPSNARVVIHDNCGRAVASLNTPGVASLKRNRRYFLPARYTAVIEAPGYHPAEVPIRSTINPWILGNVAVGGIAGLVVDNVTGAAWKPKRSEIHQQLSPISGQHEAASYSAVQPSRGTALEAAHGVADTSPPRTPDHVGQRASATSTH
jgi:hypothetical protein